MKGDFSHLHRFIVEHYDLEELRTLCFDLGIRYDNLGGEALSGKARELILQKGRQDELGQLLTALKQGRPDSFKSAGLSTDPAALEALYASLPAWEDKVSSARQHADGHHIAQADRGGTAVIGHGNVITIINSVLSSRLATLSAAATALRGFIAQHWPILLATPIAVILIIHFYPMLREKYLAKSFIGKTGAVLLAALAIPGSYYVLRYRQRVKIWLLAATLGVNLLLLSDLAWQAKQIIRPASFPPDVFGIAVAGFVQDDLFSSTRLSRQVSEQILQGVKDAIEGEPNWDQVKVKPIGLVTSRDRAEWWGGRVQADLVVWGQVFTIGDGSVWVHFEIIQTSDRASSPVFPLLLPAQTKFTQTIGQVVKPGLDAEEIDHLASKQCQIVTSFSLGLAAYFNRDYQAAITQFKSVDATIGPDAEGGCRSEQETRALLYFYLGRSYQRSGALEEGEEWLQHAARCRPEEPAVQLSIAYGYNSMGRKEEAQALAENAIDLADDWLQEHPEDIAIAYDRGLAYLLLDEPQKAAIEFDDILNEKDPTFYVAYLSAGLAYLDADDILTAIERFKAAIELAEDEGTDRSWGVLHLAEAYEKAGEVEKAKESYELAAQLAPDVDWMHFQRAKFYEAQGDIAAAEEAFKLMVETTYDEPWARGELARFLERQSRLEEAIKEFEFVCHRRRKDALSWIRLADLYKDTAKKEDAREAYETALAVMQTPHPFYHYSYAVALVYWGEYELAVTHLETAVELDPTDGQTRFVLGRTYEANRQPEQAWDVYQEILNAPANSYPSDVLQWAQERIDVLRPKLATPTPMPMPTSMPVPQSATPSAP